MSTTTTEIARIEDKTIQPIPLSERHGKARDLFTIWFGSNIMILTIVTGALATTLFGMNIVSAIFALAIGNLVGAFFMALHSAQGPKLGVPQMVQTRGQFGSYGSLLVVVLVVLMYIGFFAANLVLGGQSLATIAPAISVNWGIIIVGVVSVVATIFGYRLIHLYTRVLTFASGAALILAFVWILFVQGVPSDFGTTGVYSLAGFMSTIAVSALWQIAYAPYVSDYSRYLPVGTGPRTALWSSYSGTVLGSYFPMLLGAVVGVVLAATKGADQNNIVGGLASSLGSVAWIVIIIFSVGVAATNAMNLYCGVLSTLTIGQTFRPRWLPRAGSRTVTAIIMFLVALALAIFTRDNFLANYSSFLSLLFYVLVPWTAINLVDYYLLRHGNYKVDDFMRQDGGIYGRFNWSAIIAYLIGIVIQLPFVVTALYTGPIGKALDGVDISWIVGIVVIAPVYYFMAKNDRKHRKGQLDPEAAPLETTK